MMPTDATLEMMRRTMANLHFVEAHQDRYGPYEVTQLINSFLGALAHPWETYKQDLNGLNLSEATRRGWPLMTKDLEKDTDPTDLGDMLRQIRNGFAHGNVEFRGDGRGEISMISFHNKNLQGRRTWGATLSVADLRQFLYCFVELAEELATDGGRRA